MPAAIAIQPCGAIRARIRPPGSKSITNRALICAALAEGRSHLSGVLDSDDTRLMIAALEQLGLAIQFDSAAATADVAGCQGRIPVEQADLFIGNSGTTVRFLTALLTLGQGVYRLDGTPRMRQRPIADLLDALAQLGTDVRSESGSGCPPVVVRAQGLPGGTVRIRGDVSSQFLSGLLLAAPYARQPMAIEVEGALVSQPYVEMTLGVMAAFGVEVSRESLARFLVPHGAGYHGRTYEIEPDASAASYFLAAAAITGGEVAIEGLSRGSLQGDIAFADVLARMGCRVDYQPGQTTLAGGPLRGIEVDMNPISDTVQTLAAVALFAQGPTRITGVAHIRHKETDRIGDLARELRKLGAAVEEHDDGLTITPAPLHGAEIDTYDDHRMAMSLALPGLRVAGVVIRDPQCTSKTYPGYFTDLQRVCRTGSPGA